MNTLTLYEEGQFFTSSLSARETELEEVVIMNDFTIRSSSSILHHGVRIWWKRGQGKLRVMEEEEKRRETRPRFSLVNAELSMTCFYCVYIYIYIPPPTT